MTHASGKMSVKNKQIFVHIHIMSHNNSNNIIALFRRMMGKFGIESIHRYTHIKKKKKTNTSRLRIKEKLLFTIQ